MDVELRQLEALIAVKEERSFTAAGNRLHLSQQSVSALIRRLERNLGVTLFLRTTRNVEPTAVCAEICDDVTTALVLLEEVVARVGGTAPPSPLRLAFTPSMGQGLLHELLAALAAAPLAFPQVRELKAEEITDALRSGWLDAGVGVGIGPADGLEAIPWRDDNVELLVSGCHPLATHRIVRVAELDATLLGLPDQANYTALWDALQAAFRRAGVKPMIDGTLHSAGRVDARIAEGCAATIWLSGMKDRYMPKGLVRIPLVEPEIVVTTMLLVPTEPRSESQRQRIEVLKRVVMSTADG